MTNQKEFQINVLASVGGFIASNTDLGSENVTTVRRINGPRNTPSPLLGRKQEEYHKIKKALGMLAKSKRKLGHTVWSNLMFNIINETNVVTDFMAELEN